MIWLNRYSLKVLQNHKNFCWKSGPNMVIFFEAWKKTGFPGRRASVPETKTDNLGFNPQAVCAVISQSNKLNFMQVPQSNTQCTLQHHSCLCARRSQRVSLSHSRSDLADLAFVMPWCTKQKMNLQAHLWHDFEQKYFTVSKCILDPLTGISIGRICSLKGFKFAVKFFLFVQNGPRVISYKHFWWDFFLLSRKIVYLPESARGVTFFVSGVFFLSCFPPCKISIPKPTKVSEMVSCESSQLICDTNFWEVSGRRTTSSPQFTPWRGGTEDLLHQVLAQIAPLKLKMQSENESLWGDSAWKPSFSGSSPSILWMYRT